MNIQTLEQALVAMENSWRMDAITSEMLPAIHALRLEIARCRLAENLIDLESNAGTLEETEEQS